MSLMRTLTQLSVAVALVVSASSCETYVATTRYYDATPNGFVSAYEDQFGYSSISLLKVSSEQPGYFVVRIGDTRYALNIDTLYWQYGNDMLQAASDFRYVSGPYWGTFHDIGDSTVVDYSYTDVWGTNWYQDYWGYFYNKGHKNNDVSQRISDSEKGRLAGEIALIMNKYGMSEKGATKLAMFAKATRDLVSARNKKITKDDQAAFERSLMSTAGVTAEDVQAAVAKAALKGEEAASAELFEKAAKSFECKSSACVRDQVVPQLLGGAKQ